MSKSIKYQLLFWKYLSILLLTFTTSLAFAQNIEDEKLEGDKYFDGFYVGFEAGFQNIFSGAFINNVDVLAQKSGLVLGVSAGYRRQLIKDRLLIGAELQWAFTDGELDQAYFDYRINYKNHTQFGYGVNIGVVLGERKSILLFAYGKETKRDFDIAIVNIDGTSFSQKDSQVFFRYGFGGEFSIDKRLRIAGTIGGVETDYGDLETTMAVDDKLDFNLGIVYQF